MFPSTYKNIVIVCRKELWIKISLCIKVVVIIKVKLFDELIIDMSKCKKCISMHTKNNIDCSLISIYENTKFAKEIPSIWTDWYNRLDSKIMIIGQDWGPFEDMRKLNEEYWENPKKENWVKLIEDEKSLTKKQLTKYLLESSKGKINSINDIYITNAIMCGRKGNNYRGNNINLKCSTLNCKEFLFKQIEIVKPKVILTLGYYLLYSLSNTYNFKIEENLTKTIEKYPIIEIEDFIIVPLYHPVAQITKEKQMEQYKRIWNYI